MTDFGFAVAKTEQAAGNEPQRFNRISLDLLRPKTLPAIVYFSF